MPLKLKWPYKYRLLKVASDGKFGRLEDYDFYWKNGKKILLKHQGSDYRLPCGIPFHSPVKGKVDILEKRSYGYGYFVRIKFGVNHIGFAHNSRLDVRLGQTIKVGQLLGLTGSTGAGSGCHSHVELRLYGKVINPETMIQWTIEDKMSIDRYKKSISAKISEITNLKKAVKSKATEISNLKKFSSQQKEHIKTLQTDSKKVLKTMSDQSIIIDDTREEVRVLKEKLKSCQHSSKTPTDTKKGGGNGMLEGKKTYIVVAVLILSAIGQYLTGDITLSAAVTLVLGSLGLGALRRGIEKQ